MKKILFVYINRFVEYPILFEYCVWLQTNGYKVYYIGIADSNESYTSNEGIEVIHFDKKDIKSPLHFAKLVNQQTKLIKPDLVHVFHFRWCLLLPICSFFYTRYLLDVRTVHVANSKGRHSILTPLKNFLTWFESQFYSNSIALTKDIKRILTPAYKYIPIIPLGANLSKFKPKDYQSIRENGRKQLGLLNTDTVFLYSGTLNPIRKLDVVLHAFANLLKKNENATLIIAGDDKDSKKSMQNLKALCEKLNISDKVNFTGFLSYGDLIKMYLVSDVGLCFVPQTSYFNHQPPTKLFEYLAARLLVIATKTAANKAIIKDNVNGFLCGDTREDLTECLYRVVAVKKETAEAILKEANKVVRYYSWEAILQNNLEPFYRKILDHN